jgi:hypothetical protein
MAISAAEAEIRELQRLRSQITQEALHIYRPQPQQLPVHLSTAIELIVRGGKRSGKTSCCAVEFASRVLGQKLTGPDGQQLPLKYPVSKPSDPCLYWIIGWDTRHIGETIFPKLFMPGLFRIIKDEKTKQWRIWNRANPADAARKAESQPAEPLIPPRMIKQDTWCWDEAASNTFKSVELVNGAKICAYISSARHPKQGDAVHGIWIDEDIQIPTHLKEWQDRLTDEDGWLLWSVWPHAKNPALVNLLQKAEREKEENLPKPRLEAFKLVMTDNQYIGEASKENSLARMDTEEDIARRNEGELLMDHLSMYPDYLAQIHHIRPGESIPGDKSPKSIVERILEKNGRLPAEWTHYVSCDPSHTRTALHLMVVPPPEWQDQFLGELIIVFTELVVRHRSAAGLADDVLPLVQGVNLEAMIMDRNAGRQTHAGRDEATIELYNQAFAAKRIVSRTSGSNFIPGCNEPQQRYTAVRAYLKPNERGHARLLFVENRTGMTQREFTSYVKKTENFDGEPVPLDQPANPRVHDCMASLEYGVTYLDQRFKAGDAYVAPREFQPEGSPSYLAWKKFQERQQTQQAGGAYVHLGPGAAA